MSRIAASSRWGALILVMTGLILVPSVSADDEADILALVQKYGDLEDDLEAQAEMMHEDRVWINNGFRSTNEAKNMETQIANRKATEAINGGKTRFITSIESPKVALYGDVAVASFQRAFTVLPHNQQPVQGPPVWVTLVFVREGGEWSIAHTHQSQSLGN